MNINLKYYIVYTLAYGIVLLIGAFMYRALNSGPAWSRNFSHLAAGLISLPYPWLFSSHWWVLGLVAQSSLFLITTRYLGWLSSHHKVAPRSLGSVLFFVSIYLCFMACTLTGHKELFAVPMLLLSISDVSAAVVGRTKGTWPLGRMKWFGNSGKTVAGSLAFFLTAWAVLQASFFYYLDLTFIHSLIMALVISFISTASEALSPRGTDNFSIPVVTLIIMYLGIVL